MVSSKSKFDGLGKHMRDIILGGQDGLVNVLGVVLAVAFATQDAKIVIIAGLAAAFAESISMGAVAFTSTEAQRDYEKKSKITHNHFNPLQSGIVVGLSSVVGSLVPLISFFLTSVENAIYPSVVISLLTLFILGAAKAKLTIGNWITSGIKIMLLGGAAAAAGFIIGTSVGVLI